MKFKVLSCFFLATSMFSLQAVIVRNETSEPFICLHSFDNSSYGEMARNCVRIRVPQGESCDTKDDMTIGAMAVNVREVDYRLDQLTDQTVIIFVEDEYGVITYVRSDGI